MYNRKAFKSEAKELMRASVPHFMLVALVYVLLTTGLDYAVTALIGISSVLAGTLSVFLMILIGLFSLVMGVGFANYALQLSRKQQSGMGDLFESFSFAGRSIGVNLLVALYTFLWMLLLAAGFAVVAVLAVSLLDRVPVLGVIILVVAYIALIAATVLIVLRYAMTPFALAENPDGGAGEAVRRSVRMLRGHKGKLFVLELSFIGWDLLLGLIVLVVLGIGVFVSGTTWMFETMFALEGNWTDIYMGVQALLGQTTLWTMIAEVICLPLTLWLVTYRQTTYARFYNFVSGYDYHRYMNGEGAPTIEQASSTVPLDDPETPAQSEKPTQPKATPPQGDFYNSIIPPEPDGEEASSEDEEI